MKNFPLFVCSCFLSNAGAFGGSFLAPIAVVLTFNVVIFIWIIVVLIQHTKRTASRRNESIKRQTIVHLMISISGIMFLFGMTWFFAVLTFSSPGLREVGSTLFTVFSSLQGFFIFIFFCLASKEARESWREFLSCGKFRSSFLHPSLFKHDRSSGTTGTLTLKSDSSTMKSSSSTLSRKPASPTSPNNDSSILFRNKCFDDLDNKSQNLQAITESSVDAELAYYEQEKFFTGEDKGNMDNIGSSVTNEKNKGVHQKVEPIKQGMHDVELMDVDFYSSSSSDGGQGNKNIFS